MFNCHCCGKTTDAHERMTKHPNAVRPRIYHDSRGRIEGTGHEVIHEMKLCTGCAEKIVPNFVPRTAKRVRSRLLLTCRLGMYTLRYRSYVG